MTEAVDDHPSHVPDGLTVSGLTARDRASEGRVQGEFRTATTVAGKQPLGHRGGKVAALEFHPLPHMVPNTAERSAVSVWIPSTIPPTLFVVCGPLKDGSCAPRTALSGPL